MVQQMMVIRAVFAVVSVIAMLLFLNGLKTNSTALMVIGLVLVVGLTFEWVGFAFACSFGWIRASRRERERQNLFKLF